MGKPNISPKRLRELVRYDEDTGVFYAVVDRPHVKAGQPATIMASSLALHEDG